MDFYRINEGYVQFLQEYEKNRRGLTKVPNIHYMDRNKFAFGAVLEVNGIKYYVSVSSFDKKQEANILIRIPGDKKEVKGSLRFNYMVPVPDACLEKLVIKDIQDEKYRFLLNKEYQFCVNNAALSEWIYNIDPAFNLSIKFPLDYIWKESEMLSLDCISTLMYISFCGNKDTYEKFVIKNLDFILGYLKRKTKSHKIYIDEKKNAVHVEYILRLSDIKIGNEESVSRLKYICKTLPIYDLYCSDALKPTLNLLSAYTIPDDAHKEMPIRNIVIMFHQNLTSLWNKTIMSNYEFDTVTEWLEYWFDVRKRICLLADKCCACIYKLLGEKPLGSLAKEVDQLREEFCLVTTGEKRYPKEDRPFENNATMPKGLERIKSKYFQSIQNFTNQFAGFLTKDEQKQRLAMVNLTTAQSTLSTMQNYFAERAIDLGFKEWHLKLCAIETQSIGQLMMCCAYYQTHFANKYFNKYEIKDWYEADRRAKRKTVEEGLSQLLPKYSIHFPDEIYTTDMLSYYPIIVDSFDMSSESNWIEWFIGCTPFANSPFDYLVILYTNESGRVNPTALQFPKRMLIEVKKAIESEDYSLLEKLAPPYPVDVTAQMLDCFIEKYALPAENKPDINLLLIGDIAEELWIYSMSKELLENPEDAVYLSTELQRIQTNASGILHLLEGKLPSEDIDQISNTCKKVFEGNKFDDVLLNEFIESFVQQNINC